MIVITKFRTKIYHLIEIFKTYQKSQKPMKIHIMKNRLLKHFKNKYKWMTIINIRKKNLSIQ